MPRIGWRSSTLTWRPSYVPGGPARSRHKIACEERDIHQGLVSPPGMVETPRLEAKHRLCEMVGPLVTYPSPNRNEPDHEHLNNVASPLSFPWKRESRSWKRKLDSCLRRNDDHGGESVRSTWSRPFSEPLASQARVVQFLEMGKVVDREMKKKKRRAASMRMITSQARNRKAGHFRPNLVF